MGIKKRLFIAFFLSFLYFIIHLSIINDYGLSWDFHYHFYAGLYHLGLPVPSIDDKPPVPFTPPDPRLTVDDPFGPFTQILPTLSYKILYEKFHILPFDSAYNFPMVLIGSLGIGLLFLFISEAVNIPTAFSSSLFLAFLPVYFGYLHNNMKDIPSSFAFTLSIYLFWRLVKKRRIKDLILASFSFAFSFNTKINAILVPFVCFTWYLLINIRLIFKKKTKDTPRVADCVWPKADFVEPKAVWTPLGWRNQRLIILYFILSSLSAILLWWPFWQDPLGKLLELPYFYSRNTLNMPVLLLGKIFRSGVDIPWYYPYLYIAVTVPLPTLFFFLIGLIVCLYRVLKKNNFSLLLLVWFFLPLARYLSPKSPAIDGIRHSMEVVYPLCVIAAVGLDLFYKYLKKTVKRKLLAVFLILIIFITLVRNIIHFHPYQTSFFNGLIGGIKGAEGRFDIDFWGTPQKEAMFWLNKNAVSNAFVNVVMAQSSAGVYLRPDLRELMNSRDISESDYTVILNRESFFSLYPVTNYIKRKISEKKLVFTREIDGVSLVWIFEK